ncbi:MAG: hypothetical protein Q4G60_06990 [bacterium]|nr:hypothetical protein [bacterium]
MTVALIFLVLMIWIGFKLTGAVFGALIWLFIKLPIALVLIALGIVCCCTIILIPVGVGLFKSAGWLMMP